MIHKAYEKIDSALCVVSSALEGKNSGCIVNTVSKVSSMPPKLAVSVSKENFTASIIEQSGLFTIALLTQDVNNQVIADFGFRTSAELNKFASFAHVTDKKGVPSLTQEIAARFACRVCNAIDLGTHILFVGDVYEVEDRLDDPVLMTSYYKAQKEGSVPKASPTFQAEGQVGWRCSVCGYILESETIPDDFRCPICGQGPNKLQKLG